MNAYGIACSLAIALFIVQAMILSHRTMNDRLVGLDMALVAIVGAIVGARAYAATFHPSVFLTHPLNLINPFISGYIYYGGLIGATIAMCVYSRVRHIRLLALSDIAFAAWPLSHAIGRIGCWTSGCCYGLPYDGPFAIWSHGAYRYPTQPLEALLNTAIYALCSKILLRSKTPLGYVSATYLTSYGIGRFAIEFLRQSTEPRLGCLTNGQTVSCILVTVGMWLFARKEVPRARKDEK